MSSSMEKRGVEVDRHYIADGMFVVEVKSGRRMTTQAAFIEANGLEGVAVRSNATAATNLRLLERIDDLYLAAWTVRGSPQTAPAPLVRGRTPASDPQHKGG